MIEARIVFASNGEQKDVSEDCTFNISTQEYQHLRASVIECVQVYGHARIDSTGVSIPCASVSALSKAFILAIGEYCTKEQFAVDAPTAGTLTVHIDIDKIGNVTTIRTLAGVSLMLLRGLQGVVQEYPNELQLYIIDKHSSST